MAEIALRDVRKSYPGSGEVIHGVSAEMADGAFVVMVGPSGCGKSTLLRMVAGLEEVTSGEIAIGGRVVNRLEPKDRDIAMVFQNYALYPHMTVYDNMAYGLRNRRMPRDEIDRRVREAAGILELEALLQRRPRQLSGGQRQRVAMGRAIVREPAAFLFDEPLSNLDAKLRVQMRIEIKQLQRRLGTTSLYVTHDQIEAMTMADQLIVLNAGVAEQIGPPMAVYRKPATRFVAGFIGSPAMNFVPARLDGDGRTAVLGDTRLALDGPPPAGATGPDVVLGIRPEHLHPRDDAAADALGVEVTLTEPLGADTLVHGRLAGGGAPITVRLPTAAMPEEGTRLRLAPEPGEIHLFDSTDGRRLNA